MRARSLMTALLFVAFGVTGTPLSAQPFSPPPVNPLPRQVIEQISPVLQGATINVRAFIEGDACRAGTPPTTTIRAEADLSVPASRAPASTRFEVVVDAAVVASGVVNLGRIRRPDGSFVSENATGRASTPFTRTTFGETKTLTIRFPDLRMSGDANYTITCLHVAPSTARASGSIAMPDLAFEPLFWLALYRTPEGEGGSEPFVTRDLSRELLLWDTRLCRGHNTAWVIANIAPGLTNRGTLEVSQPVDMAFTVERAPSSVLDSPPALPHSIYTASELRFIETTVNAARSAAGGGEASLDHVARYSIPASYFPRGAARGRDATSGSEASYTSQYRNADVPLPCGGPRRLTIILDPNNVIRESDETNNTMTITYRLIG